MKDGVILRVSNLRGWASMMRHSIPCSLACRAACVTARITDFGYTVFASSPADLGTFIAAYTEKWAKVIRFSGAKVY